GAAGLRAAAVVVAVGASDGARCRQRRDQARHVRILARSGDRMIGRVHGVELETRVSLVEQALGARRRFAGAVGVTAETNLIGVGDGVGLGAGEADAARAGERPGRIAGAGARAVRVMAIGAFD